jgi:hypothetical protein
MYAVIRSYSGQGSTALLDALETRGDEIETLFRDIPGFASYTAVRTGTDSATTVTVCANKAGTDESSQRAAAWVAENLASAGGSPPQISDGATALHFVA